MSSVDFQNGFVVGMATKGLNGTKKANGDGYLIIDKLTPPIAMDVIFAEVLVDGWVFPEAKELLLTEFELGVEA